MSYTQKILKEQKEHGGVIRAVWGPAFELVHKPRSTRDPKPFVRVHHSPDGEFRYSGSQVYVDKGYTAP